MIGEVDADSATGDRQLKIAGHDGTTRTTWIDGDSSGNVTMPAEIAAATLDISGNADIDGTLEADAYTLGDAAFIKLAGTNFTGSLLLGHATSGTLDAASNNTGVGINTLQSLTTGDNNTAIGQAAGYAISTASDCVAVGTTSLRYANAQYNTAVGSQVLKADASAMTKNTGIGALALIACTGDFNTALGYAAGFNITSGDGNVIIGKVNADSATGDRQLKIAGHDGTTTTTWIDGDSSGNVIMPADVTLGDDLVLDSDSCVLKFGDDQDVTLTHTDGTGLTLNSTSKLCFYDTALSIHSSTDGQLDLIADTEIQIAATTIDINGAIDVSGNATFGGLVDVNGVADGLVIDADGDTTISSPTDDQIDFEISGADDFTMTANTFTILSGSTIAIAAGGAITNAGSMAPDITSTGKALVFGF
jgi:hypothetical protein